MMKKQMVYFKSGIPRWCSYCFVDRGEEEKEDSDDSDDNDHHQQHLCFCLYKCLHEKVTN